MKREENSQNKLVDDKSIINFDVNMKIQSRHTINIKRHLISVCISHKFRVLLMHH